VVGCKCGRAYVCLCVCALAYVPPRGGGVGCGVVWGGVPCRGVVCRVASGLFRFGYVLGGGGVIWRVVPFDDDCLPGFCFWFLFFFVFARLAAGGWGGVGWCED